MNAQKSLASAIASTLACCLILGTVACRKSDGTDKDQTAGPSQVLAPELMSNGLGAMPGAVYQTQANSPIRWQPWTKEALTRAGEARRLVFGVIAVPQQPDFQSVLATLAADPLMVAEINNNYVPVLIDGDASREMGLLTADLCSEIKRGLQLPLFVWMTAEGNPVAWIPVTSAQPGNVSEIFSQSNSMVSRMWKDDHAYVMKNSALDNASRRMRIAQRKNAKVMSEQPAEDTIRAIRQLISFYDPTSRTFDEAGGLFPSGAIDLLATAAVHPGLSPELRERAMETTRDLLTDLTESAMFDPLEGGVFASRRGASWSLPVFYRDCVGQARAAVALLNAYQATGDRRVLEKALGAIAFAEKKFVTPDGLFAAGLNPETDQALWLWSVEEVENELAAEDAAWWIKATGMKGLGNLPSEVDPRREFFRSNSLAVTKSLAELAAEQSMTVEEFQPRFEAVRKKLLNARNAKLGVTFRDANAHAGATFRMVSAHAAAFAATGDETHRQKAMDLLKKSRDAFSDGPQLRIFPQDVPDSIGAGRAFHYGLALQASLDVAVITSDETWLVWAEDLATTAAELFTDSEFLKECPDEAKIIDLPVTDLVMLFDDSTAGLISMAECRLAHQARPLVNTFSQLATPLPTYAVERPILHTDLLQATLARHFNVVVIPGADISPDLALAIQRLPVRMVQRRPAKPEDGIPAGAAKVVFAGGESRIVTTAAGLQEVVLPWSPKY